MLKCMWLFLIMMTLFLQHHVAMSASYNETAMHLTANIQKLALFQFKLSFTINTSASEICEPSRPKTMNWSMSSDCCTWDGVTCDHMTGNVIGLDLSCSHLVGSIRPDSTLFNLSFLQIISFGSNNLHGVLPLEIFHLPNLEVLDLQGNSHLIVNLPKNKWGSSSSLQVLSLSQTLFGGIPDSIGYLESLTFLALWRCNISGPIPRSISNLTQLTYLNFGSNLLSGPIPVSLANIRNLKILYLEDNKFSGPIPRSIGNLTQLILLSLHSNHLTDRIPDSLAGLQNLTLLDLHRNNLIDQFPSWVSNFRELFFLDLSENLLTGPLPSNLTLPKLTLLNLSDNLLNGTIPSLLFNFPSLTNLYIDYNKFTGHVYEFNSSKSLLQGFSCSNNLLGGTIPYSFSELINLNSLDFSSNYFSGVLDIEMFSPLKYLESLDLSYNSLLVRSTSTAMLPPRLQYLHLSSCKIKEFPHFIRNAKSLAYLDLSNNQIYGELPQWIGSMEMYSLNYLNISHNSLTGGLEHLPWNKLIYLDLQSNMLQGSLPSSICNSSSLDILNLSHNNLSGVLPSCTRSLNYSLSVFDLRMNSIGGSLPSTLINFRKLRSLNLHGNELKGKIPPPFSEFDHLEVFDLGNNQINDTFPHWLEALQNLQVLILRSNKFSGIISNVSKIKHPFPSLRIIDLSDNEFSGPLPAKYIQNFKGMMNTSANKMERSYMGNSRYSDTTIMVIKGVEIELVKILTILTTIDLSRNKFEGEIPEYIGNLESLRYLNLSHNSITGHIPSLIGKLSMLESLDLSFNLLVGAIPQDLTSIYTLSHLNLSQNDLSGHIPEGAQFNTFENNSYAGNSGLCGRPLSKKCITKTQQEKIEDDEDDDGFFFSGFTWEAVAIGYGCGVLVGFVVGYIMFMVGKPKWYTGIIARELGLKVRRLEIRSR